MRKNSRNVLAGIFAFVISYAPFMDINRNYSQRESAGGQLYWPRLRILEKEKLLRSAFCMETEALKSRDFYFSDVQ